jgi:hypothetical protein
MRKCAFFIILRPKFRFNNADFRSVCRRLPVFYYKTLIFSAFLYVKTPAGPIFPAKTASKSLFFGQKLRYMVGNTERDRVLLAADLIMADV